MLLHFSYGVTGVLLLVVALLSELRGGSGRWSRIVGAIGVAFLAAAKWFLAAAVILVVIVVEISRLLSKKPSDRDRSPA